MQRVTRYLREHYRSALTVFAVRILPSLVLIAIFVFLTHVYNQWTGLTQFYLVRRTVAATGLGVLLFGPAVMLHRRTQFIYLGLVSLLTSALFVLNFLYTSYAGGFLSVSALSYVWQVTSIGGSIRSLIGPQLLLFTLPAVATVVLFLARPRPVDWPRYARPAALVTGALLVLAPALAAGYIMVGESRASGSAANLLHAHNSDELVKKVGIINYSVYDAIKYTLTPKGLTPEQRQFILDHKDAYRFKPEGQIGFASQAGKNVIYLQLESIQEFLIGLEAKGRPVMPNLTQLAGESLHFTNFHYQVGPGTSSDAEFTALNSLMYLGDSAAFFEYPAGRYEALPKTLRDHGYTTVAMHGDTRFFWNRANIYPGLGYQHFYDIKDYTVHETGLAWGVSDKDFYAQSVPKLEALARPYWAHIISLSSHGPFKIPDQYRTLDLDGVDITDHQKDYLEAAHYADAALGQFLAELKAKGVLENTVLVVTGDHEGFAGQRDEPLLAKFLGHPEGFDDLSELQMQQVPLLIHAPGLAPGTTATPASHLDIYPTITNLLGLETPPAVLGRDLLNTKDPLVARRRRGAGVDLDMVITPQLTYVGATKSSRFEDGHCYRAGTSGASGPTVPAALTDLAACKADYDRSVERILLSDLLVRGDAVGLMK